MSTNILSIGDNAFEGCVNWEIDNVNFPGLQNLGQFSFRKTPIKSVSNLGEIATVANYTFEGCENLETVNLGDKIKTIGVHAFNGCKNLTNINLERIEVFGSAAFGDCEKLVFEDLRLPNLLSYGSEVFSGAKITKISDLGSITTLPTGGISSNNFGDKNTLKEIVLPTTLTTIPTGCFYGYKKLMNINLDHIKELGKNALRDCVSLRFEDLQLPNLEKLYEDAFYGVQITKISDLGNITELPTGTSSNHTYGDRTVLTEIVIPEHITRIPAYFMYNYQKLTTCNINSNIESIGANAFQYCSNFSIEDLNLPKLTELGAMAFYGVSIKKVSSLGSITKLLSKTGNAGGGTFMRCTELESINWPSTLTEIGYSTCQSCSKLQSTIFPESLLTIGANAFQFCSSTSIMIAPKVTSIGANAFQSCQNLQYVYLGDQINIVGENAFTNCPNIVAIVCNNTNIPNITSNTFAVGKYQIYVPDSMIEEYKSATNWSEFGDKVVGLDRLDDDYPDFYQQIKQYL